MVFSSLLFVFAFLVICYAVCAVMPEIRSRNGVLLLFSLIFYAWGGPSLLVLLVGMTWVCYVGGRLIEMRSCGISKGKSPNPLTKRQKYAMIYHHE